jgi:hypothetical protein
MHIRPGLLSLALLLGTAAALPACETTGILQGDPDKAAPADEDWAATQPFKAPSKEILWDRVRTTLASEGYRADERMTRYDQGVIVTEWQALLAPNRFEGKRRRAHVEILPAGLENQWTIRVAVLKQRNADIDQPTNPLKAQWEPESVDANRTALLAWKFQRAFEPDETR